MILIWCIEQKEFLEISGLLCSSVFACVCFSFGNSLQRSETIRAEDESTIYILKLQEIGIKVYNSGGNISVDIKFKRL